MGFFRQRRQITRPPRFHPNHQPSCPVTCIRPACSLKFYFERVACIRKMTPAALHLCKAVRAALQAFHLARWRGTDDSPETPAWSQ